MPKDLTQPAVPPVRRQPRTVPLDTPVAPVPAFAMAAMAVPVGAAPNRRIKTKK